MANPRYTDPVTPATNPELFEVIPAGKVQVGDIFRGNKNPSKWYTSLGDSSVDSFRTYFRRKAPVAATPAPAGAGTAAPAAGGLGTGVKAGVGITDSGDGDDQFLMMHFHVKIGTKSKFLALLAALGETLEGDESEQITKD